MAHHPDTEVARARRAWRTVACGIVALAAAMGIGRFAFTPLLPLMQRDGVLDAAAGSEWAALNYAGYLAGGLTAAWFARAPRLGLLASLAGVAAATLAAGWVGHGLSIEVGAALRCAAGVFSAWTLVCASGLCLGELARLRAVRRGAWIYTGVGLGIALAGTLAWAGGRLPADRLWIAFGALAAAAAVFVGAVLPRSEGKDSAPPARAAAPRQARDGGRSLPLVVCYAAFGFGYIIPATFLPAMARRLVSDPLVFGLTWPLFGLAAAMSVAGAARFLAAWPRRRVWALAQGVMALGTALPLAAGSLWALAASAVMVGGTFMVATMAGLQLAREARPDNPTPLLARMTVGFAAGQILAPVLVRLLGAGRWAGWDAVSWGSAAATVLLALTAAWLWAGEGAPRVRGMIGCPAAPGRRG